MKFYLKKDYWYHKEKSFAITYTNKFEKIVKYIIHFILDKMPVKFYYVGHIGKEVRKTLLIYDTPLKQIAYQPTIQRDSDGKIVSVLPYSDIGLFKLFDELKREFEHIKPVTTNWTINEYHPYQTVKDKAEQLNKYRKYIQNRKGYK